MAVENGNLEKKIWSLCINGGGLLKFTVFLKDKDKTIGYDICAEPDIFSCPYMIERRVYIKLNNQELLGFHLCSYASRDLYKKYKENERTRRKN